LHANGLSLVIKEALELPEQFLTKIPLTARRGVPLHGGNRPNPNPLLCGAIETLLEIK